MAEFRTSFLARTSRPPMQRLGGPAPSRVEHGTAASLLTVFLAAAATWASAGGLTSVDLYRDNRVVTAAWRGADLVTLFVGVPVLLLARMLARGSARAQLVWLGAVIYLLYDYTFYLFGAAFNRFFLLYVALFALSIATLIFALPKLQVAAIARRFRAKTPARSIASYMLFTALGLGLLWTSMALQFVSTGRVPEPVLDSNQPTSIVLALDLALLVPALSVSAFWLWRRQPWGYVLGTMLNVMGSLYTLTLSVTSVLAMLSGVVDIAGELPFWVMLTAGNLSCSTLLLYHLQPTAAGG
jgi:hypothetical protein